MLQTTLASLLYAVEHTMPGHPAIPVMRSIPKGAVHTVRQHMAIGLMLGAGAERVSCIVPVPSMYKEKANEILSFAREQRFLLDHVAGDPTSIFQEERVVVASFIATSGRNPSLVDGAFSEANLQELLVWLRTAAFLSDVVGPDILDIYRGLRVPVLGVTKDERDEGRPVCKDWIALTNDERRHAFKLQGEL